MREPGVVGPPEEMLISEIPEPAERVRRIMNSAVAARRGLVGLHPRSGASSLRRRDREVQRRRVRELVQEIVMPVPTSVIAVLLGAPAEDYALWGAWSDEVVQELPALQPQRSRRGTLRGPPEFTAYVDAMIAARKADPDPPPDSRRADGDRRPASLRHGAPHAGRLSADLGKRDDAAPDFEPASSTRDDGGLLETPANAGPDSERRRREPSARQRDHQPRPDGLPRYGLPRARDARGGAGLLRRRVRQP